jgi:DNA mismatch repair ATPase MutS
MDVLKERDLDLTETFHSEEIIQHSEMLVNQNKKQINKEEPLSVTPYISKIKKLLDEIDPEQITPLEALNLICQWKKLAGIPQQKQIKPVKDENSNLSLFD